MYQLLLNVLPWMSVLFHLSTAILTLSQGHVPCLACLIKIGLLNKKKQNTAISRVISILRGLDLLHTEWDNMRIERFSSCYASGISWFWGNVLYRKQAVNGVTNQLILNQNYRQVALEGLHKATGHRGVDHTMDLVSARFYWPHMQADVENKKLKARADHSAPLLNIQTSRPLELVCMITCHWSRMGEKPKTYFLSPTISDYNHKPKSCW